MIYDYEVTTGTGESLSLADYKGKVILVVNTATGCGFTPQYEPIEQLYKDYHDKGLEVLEKIRPMRCMGLIFYRSDKIRTCGLYIPNVAL